MERATSSEDITKDTAPSMFQILLRVVQVGVERALQGNRGVSHAKTSKAELDAVKNQQNQKGFTCPAPRLFVSGNIRSIVK